MFKRIFVSIEPPEKIKQELSLLRSEFPSLPAKWTDKEKIHLTLSFLGQVKEKSIPMILKKLKEILEKEAPFLLKITRLSYIPEKTTAKMIWALFEESTTINNVNKEIVKKIGGSNDFLPHITLARINSWNFRKLETDEVPDLNRDLNISFPVDSVSLMESKNIRGKSVYQLIEKIKLR
ncbi:MAG: RNA 2',3'-cyclic phosphodiesterase [Minisyncoccales bacterium]|jgi:2'-5' RNA ligase